MSDKDRARIVELQRQLKFARDTLGRIASGCRDAETLASNTLCEMMPLDPKYPLQTTVGHNNR